MPISESGIRPQLPPIPVSESASGSNWAPARVSRTERVVRSNSLMPSSSSSLRICWLSADCTTNSPAAAVLKLPVRAMARKLALKTPDHFMGESGPDAYWSSERVLGHLRELPGGVTEFMTHPGYYDDELSYSRYGRQRETEMTGLTDPEARALIEREGIRLIHFGNL